MGAGSISLYYKGKVDRPLWVIDSDTAQGSGNQISRGNRETVRSDEGDEGEPFWWTKSIINEQSADRVWLGFCPAPGEGNGLS